MYSLFLTLMTNIPIRTKRTGTKYWKIQDRVSLMKYSLRLFKRDERCLKNSKITSFSFIYQNEKR